jgi:hypothetical protein
MLLVAAMSAAIAQTPPMKQHGAWLSFCMGYYAEVKEQATQADNGVLYQKADEKSLAVVDEMIATDWRDPLRQQVPPGWFENGERAAGKGLWEAAPLSGDPHVRPKIAAMTSPIMRICDDIARKSFACCGGTASALKEFNAYLESHPKCRHFDECPVEDRIAICQRWGHPLGGYLSCGLQNGNTARGG